MVIFLNEVVNLDIFLNKIVVIQLANIEVFGAFTVAFFKIITALATANSPEDILIEVGYSVSGIPRA